VAQKRSAEAFFVPKEPQELDTEVDFDLRCHQPPSQVIVNNVNRLSVTFINVQCLRSKWNLLSLFDQDTNPDIICASEHWLDDVEAEFYCSLNDKLLRGVYCRTLTKGGGTAIYVNSNISCKKIDIHPFCADRTFEASCVKLCSRAVCVVVVYRPPGGNFTDFLTHLDNCLSFLTCRESQIVLGGDFNVHLNCDTPQTYQLSNLLSAHGFYLANFSPTRGEACLDSVAVNFSLDMCSTSVINPVVADHQAVNIQIDAPTSVSPPLPSWHSTYVRTYRKVDENSTSRFKAALAKVDWVSILQHRDDQHLFDVFFGKFLEVFELCFPSMVKKPGKPKNQKLGRPVKVRPKLEWYTPELGRLKEFVKTLHDRYKSSPNLEDKTKWQTYYRAANRLYKCKVEEAKKAGNERFIREAPNPCKAAWQVINSNRQQPQGSKCRSSPDDVNNYFRRSVQEIIQSIPEVEGSAADGVTYQGGETLTTWEMTTPEEIHHLVKQFKDSASPDFYGVTVGILKQAIEPLAAPIAMAVNDCLSRGVFPDPLKISKVVPIYKKGDPDETSSYRPIAVIPVIAKVLESVMKKQLVSFLERNDILDDAQHGFRKGRSTTTAMISLAELILDAFENGDSVALTLCDLSKAFDVMSPDIALDKFESYGVRGTPLSSLKDYFRNRKRVVCIDGAVSAPLEDEYGAPQGSVMAPVIFITKTNDFCKILESVLFADDTNIISRDKNVTSAQDRARGDLTVARHWFRLNKLQLNDSKTQTLVCTLSTTKIPDNKEVKLLGFYIDQRLTWECHIKEVSKRLARVTFLLRKLSRCVSKDYLMTAYYGLFHSHIIYGLLLWGHAPGCGEVLRLQKAAVRVITSSGHLDHCKPMFQKLGILTVFNQYIFNCVIYTREHNIYATRDQVHTYNTRGNNLIDIPRCRLTKTQKRFPVMAWKIHNALPNSLQRLNGPSLKIRLRAWLVDRPFYSLAEYFECCRNT